MAYTTPSGLRPETEERLQHPPPSGCALVILGDSIVYGWGLAYTQSYPALVERWLKQGEHVTGPWYVVNAGIPGDTAVMGGLRYARDVRPFQPRLVLLAFGLNDGALRRTLADVHREHLWREQHQVWMRGKVLVRRGVRKVLRSVGIHLRRRPYSPIREEAPRVGPELFGQALYALVRQARQDGAAVGLLTLPPRAHARLTAAQAESYARYDDLIRAVARRARVPLLDVSGDAAFDPETMLAEDGLHLTANGQAWLARKVYIYLQHAMDETWDSWTHR